MCKEGCKTVAVLAFCLRLSFLPLLEYLVPALLKQAGLKVQVMAAAADKSLRIVIASLCVSAGRANLSADAKLLALLAETCGGRSAATRRLGAEYVALACALWRPELLERSGHLSLPSIRSID